MIKKYINMLKDKLSSNKGFSYVEFLLMLMVLVGTIFLFIQIYGIINVQVLVSNTAKNTLRRVELAGQAAYTPDGGSAVDIIEEAKKELKKNSNIDEDSIKVYLNRPNDVDELIDVDTVGSSDFKYQIRRPIKVRIVVKYNFLKINGLTNIEVLNGGIPLSASYQGASEKFFKNPDNNADLEYNPLNVD